jgi:hypothetical protein
MHPQARGAYEMRLRIEKNFDGLDVLSDCLAAFGSIGTEGDQPLAIRRIRDGQRHREIGVSACADLGKGVEQNPVQDQRYEDQAI